MQDILEKLEARRAEAGSAAAASVSMRSMARAS